ncbi:MAG TPA: tRNA/rRNA methyltransferase [Bacteroidales bacterium]|nr:tRNA/rRNA methyltransferase [Bacteroidales bacterium]
MQIIFILVEPAVPENVGAAARALKTMGFGELRLVRPCTFLEGKARWVAHASAEILEQASVFDTLSEALTDVDFAVATSAKERSVRGDHHAANLLPELLQSKVGTIQKVAIVFGREESGLTNDEMALCHISTYVPMATAYPSLNLAQAVMLYAYILSSSHQLPATSKVPVPDQAKLSVLLQQTKEILADTHISRSEVFYNRILERLALLNDNDTGLMLAALSAILEKYGSKKEGG